MGFLISGYKNSADVPVEYWKCLNCNIDNFYKTADIKFGGWVSKRARTEGKEMVETHMVRCMTDNFDKYFGIDVLNTGLNPIKQAYVFAQANDGFYKIAVNDNDTSE